VKKSIPTKTSRCARIKSFQEIDCFRFALSVSGFVMRKQYRRSGVNTPSHRVMDQTGEPGPASISDAFPIPSYDSERVRLNVAESLPTANYDRSIVGDETVA
jgi:hypothetical protein